MHNEFTGVFERDGTMSLPCSPGWGGVSPLTVSVGGHTTISTARNTPPSLLQAVRYRSRK